MCCNRKWKVASRNTTGPRYEISGDHLVENEPESDSHLVEKDWVSPS